MADQGQWQIYINPFNNLFLYYMGIAIYYNFKDVAFNKYHIYILLVISIISFVIYPVIGDQVNLVTGVNRILLSIISGAIVLSFYKFPQELPKMLSVPLEQFGIATYGVYLLHPIVLYYVVFVFKKIDINNSYLTFATVVIVTISMAILSFNLLEKKLIKIGKKYTTIQTTSPNSR